MQKRRKTSIWVVLGSAQSREGVSVKLPTDYFNNERLAFHGSRETVECRTDPGAASNLPVGSHPDAIRLHIPRALRVVYDIRNNRNAAHLGDGIDPNKQDATIVISTLDWVLAEFVRLYHTVSADEAQRIVESLVTKRAPAVQDFAGFLKVLNSKLKAGDYILLLLYERGAKGASFA